MSYEAMYLTRRLKDLQSDAPDADLDWEAAIAFVNSLQNEDGGFIYKPGESKAGAVTNEAGEVTFRSYGSMTYAGLLSLIYADMDREDPRVRSAVDWAVAHWTLEENPGMGQEGLYYFYNVLTKALAAYGQDVLHTADGETLAWRPAVVRRLVSLQRIDEQGRGFWQNPEGRWWEQDPVLVTAYSLIALQIAMGTESR
jgi:squalene-hopene/tetraprenyl-beta-curcumene cyclase